jgi:outer membrane receptor protein involved in Fe transport
MKAIKIIGRIPDILSAICAVSATLLLALWLVSFCPASAMAQFTYGTILGTVTDPSGAAVPGASVTAQNLDTGVARRAETTQGGDYLMSNMPLGRYQVKAEASGFKTAVVGPLTLVVDQKLRSDFKLELGSLSQVVEVTGVGGTMLQTEQPDMNQIVQEKEIRGLPLNGRDFFALLMLSNGLQDTSNDQGGATTNVTFSVNGMRPEANSVTLDGVEMSSIRESDVDLRPNLDAISEFKVLTSTFSAEYGHTAGGVISIQTKSGTNTFHGSAYEFLRNESLNAANFFTVLKDPTKPFSADNPKYKPPLKQNMFGATLGGPIKKNKAFFFMDYQGYVVHRINTAFGKVPEAEFRDGDFSSLLPDPMNFDPWDPGDGIGIYDPATGSAELFRDPSRATPDNPEGLNIIPWDCTGLDPNCTHIHPLGWALINAQALPNLPADFPLGNYFIRQPQSTRGNEAGLRIDYTFSTKDNFFFRYRWNDSFLDTADPFARPDGPMPGIGLEVGDDSRGIVQGGTHRDRNNNMVLSEVHTFSPTLVNEARFGFHYYRLDVFQHAYGMNLAEKFGLAGVNVDPLFSGLPIIYMNNYNSLGGDDWKPLFFRERSWQLNDNLTWMTGRHALKTGFEYRPQRQDNYYTLFPHTAWWTSNIYTSLYVWWWQGHELADVLIGMPGYGYHGRRFGSPVLKDQQYSFFLQDDWKVTDKLTLNLGVRYEYVSPFYSPTNDMALFDMAQGTLLYAGKDGVSRYILYPDRNNWAPRVGLAYKVNPKTTLRAGFGVYFDPENAKRDDIKFNPPAYRQYTTDPYSDAYPDDPNQYTWNFWSPEPPPFQEPGSYPTGYDIFNVDRKLVSAYSEQYNLAVQRELPGNLLFEAAYVGSQAHKLPYIFNYNQPQRGGVPQPYPDLGTINEVRNIGDMNYHSGQFKLERRFGKGLYFLTSYTWSKAIDTVSSANFDSAVTGGVQNMLDPGQNRGVSDWDVPHRLAFSYVYDLPFGKGLRYLSNAPTVVNHLLGGWQVSGVLQASSGVPGTVSVGSTIPGGDARPNLVGNPNLPSGERSPDNWFNTEAFVANTDEAGNLLPGDAGRNILRGPRYTNVDLGVMKFFSFTERVRLQFRAEFFNLSNTPHFALPMMRMSDVSFGRLTHTRNPVNFGSTGTSYANRMIQFALKLEF